MASAASIQIIGDWRKNVSTPLSSALRVSTDMFHRTLPQACKHAVILMAQSARKLTPKAKKNRQVLEEGGLKYVNAYQQGKAAPVKIHKFRFDPDTAESSRLDGTWEAAKRIKNAGLGKKSWMWGLGTADAGRPIPGASVAYPFKSKKVVGFVKQNKLSYIDKIMPDGWREEVARLATNKILGQAARKLERAWASSMKYSGSTLSDFMPNTRSAA